MGTRRSQHSAPIESRYGADALRYAEPWTAASRRRCGFRPQRKTSAGSTGTDVRRHQWYGDQMNMSLVISEVRSQNQNLDSLMAR